MKKKIIICEIIFIFILIGAITFGIIYKTKSDTKKQYITNLNATELKILDQSSKCETITNTYSNIWHGAIYDKSGVFVDGIKVYDFNYAISLQSKVFQKNGDISSLQAGRKDIETEMKKLNQPPEEYKDLYQIVFDMYGNYTEFESLSESPTGSLSSYNSKTKELDDAISKKYNEFKVKVPDNKDSKVN